MALNVFINEVGKRKIPKDDKESPDLALQVKDKQLQPHKNEHEFTNLTNENEPKIIQIGKNLSLKEKEVLVALLREFQEVFAWSYEDMLGIDTDIVQHKIPTYPEVKAVKQKLWSIKSEWTLKIKEVEK